MNPFETPKPIDEKVCKELERLDAVTKARVFGLTQRDVETAAMRESWVHFTQLLDRNVPVIDVAAAVAAIDDRLQARRRRKLLWMGGGLLGFAAAACVALAVWPELPIANRRVPALAVRNVPETVDDESAEDWLVHGQEWLDEIDLDFSQTWEAVADWESDFHQSPSAATYAMNQALSIARELDESTF